MIEEIKSKIAMTHYFTSTSMAASDDRENHSLRVLLRAKQMIQLPWKTDPPSSGFSFVVFQSNLHFMIFLEHSLALSC